MHFAWPRDYHSLSLTRCQFHSPKVTPLTNPAEVKAQLLCYCNSNAWGMTQQPLKWSRRHNRSAYFPWGKKALRWIVGTITSTIPCCDRFDRNCVNINNTEPPIPAEQSLLRMPYWLTLSNAALEPICTILASWPLYNALCSVWDTHKSASQVLRPSRWANWLLLSTPLHSINCQRWPDTGRSNTRQY